jgi:hypothetical protein
MPNDNPAAMSGDLLTVIDLTPTTTFDYSGVCSEEALSLQRAADDIRTVSREAIEQVGKHLIAVKGILPHGEFSKWASAELNMTVRSAENYMRAAGFLAGKPKSISCLPPSTIYRLAAPSAPADVVAAVVEAATAGNGLSEPVIKLRLDEAAEARRKEKLREDIRQKRARGERVRYDPDREQERQERDRKQREREEADRVVRLTAFADKVTRALGDDDVATLRSILSDWDDRQTFWKLLSHAAGGAL